MPIREVKRAARVPLPKDPVNISVGVHSDDAQHTHGSGDGTTIGDIATWMEMGTQTVPPRSFIRAWADERGDFIAKTMRAQMAAVVAGKRPLDQALERIALAFEGDVKQRIRRNIPPPLKPATIARKGSSVALIDTGALVNSIRARVERGGTK